MKVLPNVNNPERIKSEVINTGLATQSRAYTPEQVAHLVNHQKPHNALATEIAYEAGLRAHELFTIKPIAEQPISTHRTWTDERFTGRDGVSYSVVGKGGLIREVKLSKELSNRLEQTRLLDPKAVTDRKINYTKVYDIGAGKIGQSRIKTRVWLDRPTRIKTQIRTGTHERDSKFRAHLSICIRNC